MKNTDGCWIVVPPDLPTGPMWPEAERQAARKRVAVKRAFRRALRRARVEGIEVR